MTKENHKEDKPTLKTDKDLQREEQRKINRASRSGGRLDYHGGSGCTFQVERIVRSPW